MAIDIGANVQQQGLKANPDQQQWSAAFRLALGIIFGGALLTLVLAYTAYSTSFPTPNPPSPPFSDSDMKAYETLIGQYKVLKDLQVGQFSQLFQLVILSAALPLVTGLFGYLFGRQKV